MFSGMTHTSRSDKTAHPRRALRPILLASALGLAAAGCAVAHADTPATTRADVERACAGLDPELRGKSVLEGTEAIVRVKSRRVRIDRPHRFVPIGADVAIRANAESTPAFLQRRAQCEIAQNAVYGEASPTYSSRSPLAVRDVDVHVKRRGSTYVLEIRSDEPSSARDVQDRAHRLVADR
jgi:hypothetical protein